MDIRVRYLALDGLRGIFAIAVLLHHIGLLLGVHFMKSAWLAVDAFFILSGFVVTLSYERRILVGLAFKSFFKMRLLRLYPMYFIGFLLGCLSIFLYTKEFSLLSAGLEIIFGFFLFPFIFNIDGSAAFGFWGRGVVYPLNDPSWSLFFEIFSNIVFWGVIVFFKKNVVKFLFLLIFPAYVLSILSFGWHSGYSVENFSGGFFRVLYHFFLGYFLFHVKRNIDDRYVKVYWIFLAFILFSFNFGNIFLIAFVLFVGSPITIWLGSQIVVVESSRLGWVCAWLGRLSFPLYITHYPLIKIFNSALGAFEFDSWVLFLMLAIGALVASHFLLKLEPAVKNGFAKLLDI
jgi:peptidoglycan/LPS O-acetylase OafA/YrhL